MPDGNTVSMWSFYYNRTFFNSAYCQYSNLRLVDNWGSHKASKCTYIGKSKCTLRNIFRFQFAIPGTVGQAVNLLCQANQIQLICIPDYRNYQITGRQGSGHTNIDVFFYNNIISINRRIDQGKFLDAVNDCFNK